MAEVSRRVMPDFIVAGSIDELAGGYELNMRLVLVEGYSHIWATSIHFDSSRKMPEAQELAQAITAEISAQPFPPQRVLEN